MATNDFYYIYTDTPSLYFPNNSLIQRYTKEELSLNLMPSSSLDVFYIASSTDPVYNATSSIGTDARLKINSLKNTINWYSSVSRAYDYNQFTASAVAIVNVPVVLYGKSIKKGSLKLDFYYTGSLIGRLEDVNKDGAMIETTGSNTGSCAGIALYDEGIVLLTGSWNIQSGISDNYIYYKDLSLDEEINLNDSPRWIHWGKALQVNLTSSTFEIDFEGEDEINVISMFTYVGKNELNTSNNATFLKYNTNKNVKVTRTSFTENAQMEIKNTVKTAYSDVSGSLRKQTYITSIGIFDEEKNLIAVAKFANPIKKTDDRDFTFKLKLDV